jgi:predicted Zn-dependent protease
MLKEVNRFDEALTAYQETMARFPNNVVAHTGYAEMLKEVNRFDEALTAYQETMARFPNDVVAHTGYAEMLKEVNRFDEALTAYQETMARFPNNVVARTGYAEMLKEVSRFDEALSIYQETMARFPDNRVSKSGLAALLLTTKQFDAVQALLSTNALVSRHDWIEYHILAMSYLRQGNASEAVARLEYGLNNVRWIDIKGYFVTALALAKLTEKKFAEVEQIFTDNIIRSNRFQQQSQSIIMGHTQAALGKKVEAVHTLDNIPAAQSSNIIRIKDFLARRYSLKQYSQTEVSPSEISSLDREIEELEFSLVLRAA